MPSLILASRSPRRRELLSRFIPHFDVMPAEVDESAIVAPFLRSDTQDGQVTRASCHTVDTVNTTDTDTVNTTDTDTVNTTDTDTVNTTDTATVETADTASGNDTDTTRDSNGSTHARRHLAPGVDPGDLVCGLARAKARAIVERTRGDVPEDTVVLAADTVVILDDLWLGKPADAADARDMLTRLLGRTHYVYSGVAIMGQGREEHFFRATSVHFKPATPQLMARIDDYVASGSPLDKAGAYGIQEEAAVFVDAIDGDYDTVVGLPLTDTIERLANWGFSL